MHRADNNRLDGRRRQDNRACRNNRLRTPILPKSVQVWGSNATVRHQ
jgi:hypothetical protein